MAISEAFFKNLCNLRSTDFDLKFLFLGEGISRKVYALDKDYVIKVAKGNEGIYQNKVELYVFTHVNLKLKKYLSPIACFKPNILIMERAVPLTNTLKDKYINVFNFSKDKAFFNDLCFLADKHYLFYEDLISVSSWGMLKDNNVLIDYGCTSPFGDMFYDLKFIMNSFKNN
ncbi:hypothetical protein [Candidatus Clostridium stratigraminis]|uniref:Uncharacterized protein n=1 Tax=Candidatus Clostridium stratigraminis TaxID=3381661 RepID=A0ABW8T7V8_9CLOT